MSRLERTGTPTLDDLEAEAAAGGADYFALLEQWLTARRRDA